MIKRVKQGDIIIAKNYNIFKRIWCKLRNKELPYNDAYIATCSNTLDIDKSCRVLTLKKEYTLKEKAKLWQKLELVKSFSSVFPITYLGEVELKFVINGVRPDTLKVGSIDELMHSAYYKYEEN